MSQWSGWAYPRTLDEAMALLQQDDPPWEPIAGGTSWAFRRSGQEGGLMDLSRLPWREVLAEEGTLRLGALLSVEELRRSLPVRDRAPLLQETAESIRPHQLRNAITLGGNVVQVFAWSDFPVALLALGATLHVATPPVGLEQQVPADDFFASHPRRRLEGRLLTGVTVPARRPGRGGAFLKFARSRVDLALATAAATVEAVDGLVVAARGVVGAVRGLPLRLARVEEALLGRPVDDPALPGVAVALAREGVTPVQDLRVSKDYRAQVASVLVGRVTARALARAAEG